MKINQKEIQDVLLEEHSIGEMYWMFNQFLMMKSNSSKHSNLLFLLSSVNEKAPYEYNEFDWLWFCFWKNNKDLREELSSKYEEAICDNE